MTPLEKSDWKKLPLMLEKVEWTCRWHDDVKCPDDRDCETCGHQPPDDEKENGKKPPVPIEWESSYEASVFPMCPACGEMPYSLERCVFCGQRFIKDDRAREWEKPPEVEHMYCFICGGKDTMEVTRARSNGHRRGHCTACGARFIE